MQCVDGADGGFDDVAIGHAGSLSDRAFDLAGVLGGTAGDEPRFDVDRCRSGMGRYGAFNLGQLLGLRGLASLIPLLAIWGVAALLWWRSAAKQPRSPCKMIL